MDQESIVYGCIKDAGYFDNESERRKVNRAAMMALPNAEEWRFLSRDMFSIPMVDILNGHYHTDVMHFGASYQAVEYEWESWIQDFEALLKGMYWVSATVHLETELSGTHTFTWTSLVNGHVPGADDMQIHCEWSQETSFGL